MIILIPKKRFNLEYEPLNKISRIIFINLYICGTQMTQMLRNADFRSFFDVANSFQNSKLEKIKSFFICVNLYGSTLRLPKASALSACQLRSIHVHS